jgi:hypothetical protein
MVSDSFNKDRDEALRKVAKIENVGPLSLVGCIDFGFREGASWAKEYLDTETVQLKESLKLAVEAFEWMKNPDNFQYSCLPVIDEALAKIKTKHGEL